MIEALMRFAAEFGVNPGVALETGAFSLGNELGNNILKLIITAKESGMLGLILAL